MDNTIDPPKIPDYYRDLGVSQIANPRAIRQAFKKLALATHPDKKAGESTDAASFRKVREAYEYLSDPEKRARYDRIYFDVQDEWERYFHRLEEQNRREQERAARETEAEERRAAEAERLRKIEETRREAEEKARREKLREERARQAELRSREAARKAWEEQQRAAEERIRQQREAAAEARSKEVAERLRAEQEKAALERLKLAVIQEKLDASRRNWANLRQSGEKPLHGDKSNRASPAPVAETKECSHPQFGWPKKNIQACRLEDRTGSREQGGHNNLVPGR
ncbi:hypothetical protein O1611_g7046 [Lasiodiplodia mahajangana]|uniref:Uncharacterized protein n=1 Tax=Lasiodiplodia mahajangana TaxID=1108764 RepID=A0ACC2JH96_9PEZI|nr:hypothetical protein O1611_g7046 [Lasiodiplodia mahajangana]